jgi:hypothetical protein
VEYRRGKPEFYMSAKSLLLSLKRPSILLMELLYVSGRGGEGPGRSFRVIPILVGQWELLVF